MEFVLFRVAGSPSKWQFDEPVFFDVFCMRVLVYVILCVAMISEENHHWLEPLEPDFMNRCTFHLCSCDICGILVSCVWSSQVLVTKTGSIPLGAPLMGSTCCHTGWGVPILYLVYEIWSWKDASLQYFHLEERDFANSFMFCHARDVATFEVQQMRKISSKSFKVSHSFRGKIFSLKKSCSHPVLSSFHSYHAYQALFTQAESLRTRKKKEKFSSPQVHFVYLRRFPPKKNNSRFSRSFFQVPLVIVWKGGDMKDMSVSRYPDRFHLGAHLWWLCRSDQFVIFSALVVFSPRSVSPGWIAESPGCMSCPDVSDIYLPTFLASSRCLLTSAKMSWVQETEDPLAIKLALTSLIVLIVVPAWRMYILAKAPRGKTKKVALYGMVKWQGNGKSMTKLMNRCKIEHSRIRQGNINKKNIKEDEWSLGQTSGTLVAKVHLGAVILWWCQSVEMPRGHWKNNAIIEAI